MQEIIQKFREFARDKKRMAVVSIIAGVIILFVAVVGLFLSANRTEPEKQIIPRIEASWQEYSSDSLGFKLSHPANWEVKEDLTESGPDILVSKKAGLAFVRIRGLFDPNLNSTGAIKSSIADYQKMLALQDGVVITDFQTDDVKDNIGGFFVTGEFLISGKAYRFEERGKLSAQGRLIIMRAADAPADFDTSITEASKIMDTFKLK